MSMIQYMIGRALRLSQQMTIAKKMAACRFYHDPLRKVDFICSKKVIRLLPKRISTSQTSRSYYQI